jgi:hypothetical protein
LKFVKSFVIGNPYQIAKSFPLFDEHYEEADSAAFKFRVRALETSVLALRAGQLDEVIKTQHKRFKSVAKVEALQSDSELDIIAGKVPLVDVGNRWNEKAEIRLQLKTNCTL